MFYALYLSFFRWDMVAPRQFVGMRNYLILFQDSEFWLSLGNTVIFSLGSIIFGLGLSLIVAVMLSKKIRGLGFFRTAYFIPYIASMTAIAIVWRWILQP